jgi:hypothetical protein
LFERQAPFPALQVSIQWTVDLDAWLEKGGTLFDARTTIPYGTLQGLKPAAAKILMPAWTSGDPNAIRAAFDTFLAEFRKE